MFQKSTTCKTQSNQRKYSPLLLQNFDANKFHLEELQTTNERSESQMISYPRYDKSNFVFQTPEFKITQYGIPPLGKYAKDDSSRTTLKLPLDDQPGCIQLINMFQKLDAKMPQMRNEIFKKVPKIAPTMEYKSIIREPRTDNDLIEEEPTTPAKTTKIEKCNFWKAKLDLDYNRGNIIRCPVFVKDPDNSSAKPEKAKVENATQLSEYLNLFSTVRMIVMVNKMWAEKSPKEQGMKRKYGLAFKIMSMEVTPRPKTGGSLHDAFESYAFVDEGSSDDQPNALENGVEKTELKEETPQNEESGDEKSADKSDEESGDESQGESDKEDETQETIPEPEPEPTKKPSSSRQSVRTTKKK
jgi:hypothetical protein